MHTILEYVFVSIVSVLYKIIHSNYLTAQDNAIANITLYIYNLYIYIYIDHNIHVRIQ